MRSTARFGEPRRASRWKAPMHATTHHLIRTKTNARRRNIPPLRHAPCREPADSVCFSTLQSLTIAHERRARHLARTRIKCVGLHQSFQASCSKRSCNWIPRRIPYGVPVVPGLPNFGYLRHRSAKRPCMQRCGRVGTAATTSGSSVMPHSFGDPNFRTASACLAPFEAITVRSACGLVSTGVRRRLPAWFSHSTAGALAKEWFFGCPRPRSRPAFPLSGSGKCHRAHTCHVGCPA